MSNPIQTCQDYLERLKDQLSGADPAMIQDALNDTQDFINNERAQLASNIAADSQEEAIVRRLLDGFGSPEEVAEAYLETESIVAAAMAQKRTAPRSAPPTPPAVSSASTNTAAPSAPVPHKRTGLLDVFTDPLAYGAIFFILLSLPTGIIMFSWAVAGFALSFGVSVLVIGIPFTLFFLATIRALSLIEGRMVEALLGERMPRRADSSAPGGTWLQRLKFWSTHGRTWSSMLYMVLRLPAGIIAFSILVTLISTVIGCLAGPIISLAFDHPFITIDKYEIYAEVWMIPVGWILGAFLALFTLHCASWMGRAFAAVAKSMLVRI